MRFIHVFLLWLATVIMASPTPEPQEKPDSTSPNNKEDNNQVTAQRDRNLGRWGTIGAGAIGLVGGVLGTLGVQRFQTIRHREQFEQWLAGVDEHNFGTAWTGSQVIDCMSRKFAELQEPYANAQVHPTSGTFKRWVEICSDRAKARADEDNPWIGEIDLAQTFIHPKLEAQNRREPGQDSNLQVVLKEATKVPARYWGFKPAGPGAPGRPLRGLGMGRP